MNVTDRSCTVLITSCDAFEDCWRPYLHGLHKYWPDCPYEVRLITNEKEFSDESLAVIRVGPDQGWARNLRRGLACLRSEVVLYTHEDFWLTQPVPTGAIKDYVELVASGRADYIRLYPAPRPDSEYKGDPRLGALGPAAPYRTSLQAAVWRVSVLTDLLRDDETCWEFELQGSIRSQAYGERFLCVKPWWDSHGHRQYEGLHYVCTGINKGKWSTDAVRYSEKEGLGIDFTRRPQESRWDEMVRLYRLAWHVDRAIRVVGSPSKLTKKIKAWWR